MYRIYHKATAVVAGERQQVVGAQIGGDYPSWEEAYTEARIHDAIVIHVGGTAQPEPLAQPKCPGGRHEIRALKTD